MAYLLARKGAYAEAYRTIRDALIRTSKIFSDGPPIPWKILPFRPPGCGPEWMQKGWKKHLSVKNPSKAMAASFEPSMNSINCG